MFQVMMMDGQDCETHDGRFYHKYSNVQQYHRETRLKEVPIYNSEMRLTLSIRSNYLPLHNLFSTVLREIRGWNLFGRL